uniref:Uncharacterized protein n=1 Tax=Megaselia scalaris TaxID=36166 RepID=T1H0R4_MEGSC
MKKAQFKMLEYIGDQNQSRKFHKNVNRQRKGFSTTTSCCKNRTALEMGRPSRTDGSGGGEPLLKKYTPERWKERGEEVANELGISNWRVTARHRNTWKQYCCYLDSVKA